MNRWQARLAELQGDTSAPPAHVQNVQNVQKSFAPPLFEHFGQIEQSSGGLLASSRANPSAQARGAPPSYSAMAARSSCASFQAPGGAVGAGSQKRPFARHDHKGLLWLVNGGTIVELHRDKAIIENARGIRQSYRRRPVEVGRVVLAWELANAEP